MLTAGAGADEFDCVDCGRHMIAWPPGDSARTGTRCNSCYALPGWFYLPELRRVIEPEPWRPPEWPEQGEDPRDWHCEFPGCQAHSPLLRVNGYEERFRGRCPEHLADWIYRALHQARN